ncbi:FHA domain-containing protein [Pengzhenrongella sp.]|uniref:FHA domain-containing protein n=1 Tax=Pengzhenrongella sp. TaxID=2888820 RepID=UPI002F94A419
MSKLAGVETVGGARAPEFPDAYLVLSSGHGQARRWPLPPARGALTIGREPSAEVCVTGDARVSRVHALLERVGGQWTIVDDGLSRNGTFLNGRRLAHRVRLHDRDKIRVGETVLTFCAPPEPASLETVVGAGLPTVSRLTESQRMVLAALCRPQQDGPGYATPATNQQIAEELFLSVGAVKTHLRVLFGKFGIDALPQNQKRARLVELALQMGLVDEVG